MIRRTGFEKAALTVVAGLLTVLVSGAAIAADPPATITVSASATAAFKPDRAVLSGGVMTIAPTAREAASQNARIATQVIDAVKAAGIPDADVRTANYRLSPQIRYDEKTRVPEILGYEVVNTIVVSVSDVAKTGAILDTLLTSGANQAGSVQFIVSNLDERLDAARADAVQNAIRKARVLAESAGVALGAIQSIREGGAAAPGPTVAYARAAVESVPTPIEAGSQTASVQVTIVFGIKE
ncbi:MAG: SIMPL domain-containing protein [Pseudomonadota bacterium]